MSKITSFDRSTCRTVSQRVMEVLLDSGIEEELGIKLNYTGGRFGSTNLTLKIEAAVVAEDGSVQTKTVEAFKLMAKHYGLEPDDLGKQFTIGGKVYTITGLNTRAHKMPIQADRFDGRGFKFPVSSVQRALGRKTTTPSIEW